MPTVRQQSQESKDDRRRRRIQTYLQQSQYCFDLPLLVVVVLVTLLLSCSNFSPSHVAEATTTSTPAFVSTRTSTRRTDHFTRLRAANIGKYGAISDDEDSALKDLKVAIVGAGPSGLLLSHLLLKQGVRDIQIFERRRDPRTNNNTALAVAGYAHAFGVGTRGRTAIRAPNDVDEDLWAAVKQRGKECSKVALCLGSFLNIKTSKDPKLEPSVLLYQTDLCIALIEALEQRNCYNSPALSDERKRKHVDLNFEKRVLKCDFENKILEIEDVSPSIDNDEDNQPKPIIEVKYDLLVGCDGVNSIVRTAMNDHASSPSSTSKFIADRQAIPIQFKVARLKKPPPKLDSDTVSLVIPTIKEGKGLSAAYLPVVNGSGCILFVDRSGESGDTISDTSTCMNPITASTNSTVTAVAQTLRECFPPLDGPDMEYIAEQLIKQRAGRASSVVCNAYHYGDAVAIAGDAAHATGGVSGQGLSCALWDAVTLTECLQQHYDPSYKEQSLAESLISYSKRRVPEGKALYDLSYGPKPTGMKKIAHALTSLRDTIFQGRWGIGKLPLHESMSSSIEPFANIRKEMDEFYEEPFPDASSFALTIDAVHASTSSSIKPDTKTFISK